MSINLPAVCITEPQSAADLSAVKALFQSYMDSLEIDLAFQKADVEMASFPRGYVHLLQAKIAGEVVGAVALKASDNRICEMKRLYCLPKTRGLGVGRALAGRIVDVARSRGFERMRLDTFDTMTAAVNLYRQLGFETISPYYHNPYPGTLYFEKVLAEYTV